MGNRITGIDFGHMPCIYWGNKTKISYLQRRIIVYSIQYYLMSANVVEDKKFDEIAHQLVELQRADPKAHQESQYYYAMHDFDGSTGFDIPSRLTEEDRQYLSSIAMIVLASFRARGYDNRRQIANDKAKGVSATRV